MWLFHAILYVIIIWGGATVIGKIEHYLKNLLYILEELRIDNKTIIDKLRDIQNAIALSNGREIQLAESFEDDEII